MELIDNRELYVLTFMVAILFIATVVLLQKSVSYEMAYFQKNLHVRIRKRYISLVMLPIISFLVLDTYLRIVANIENHKVYDLLEVVDSALGIPNNMILNKVADITHLSLEEWNSPACPKAIHDNIDDNLLPLKRCIDTFPLNSILPPYCNHWSNKDCMVMSVNDYIIQRPKILKSFIDIIERPCAYIPTDQEYMHYVRTHNINENEPPYILKQLKDSLECNIVKKNRENIIVFFDDRFHLVIERRDV